MARATIDFGIDLGTTNSEIALFDRGQVRMFKNNDNRENTPSVVRIDRAGAIHVGRRAYDRVVDDPENTVAEFKLVMGGSQTFPFAASGRTLTPEELSAEVLKSLKADAARAGFDCHAAVITVPANFESVQCEATQRAAKLAGLVEAPLLQEPIAAAIAYGKDAHPSDGYWLIYDLGGGTFDVAIIKRTSGHLRVVDCAGNNYLGGKQFDWLVVEQVLLPALSRTFDLPGLERSNATYRTLMGKLKKEAEDARIALTDQESATIYLDGCGADRNGRLIELALQVSRSEYERLIEPHVVQTLRLCQQILSRIRLSPGAIERIILVGGPTITPCIRGAIQSTLGISVDARLDPITVVAKGAAVFASSQPFPHAHQTRSTGKALVKLSFSALCQQPTTMIAGRLEAASGTKLPSELRVRLTRDDQGWQSGFLPVTNEAFVCQVSLREHQANIFRIALFDEAGQSLAIEPDTLCITHGLSVANPPLPRTISVEVIAEKGQGRCEPLLLRGTPLPGKASHTFRTALALKPGSADQVLNIKVYEGEHEIPEHNRHLGTLKVTGRQVQRAVPLNAEIQVTLSVDASRHAAAQAYIPVLNETFREVLKEQIAPKPDVNQLSAELERIEAQWREASPVANADTTAEVNQQLTEVTVELAAAYGGDPGALEKADRLIREVQASLANVSKVAETPRLLESLEEAREKTRRIVSQFGTAPEHEQLRALEADAERAHARQDPRLCQDATTRLWKLYWQVLFRQDGFWVGVFQDLTEQGRFTDDARAQALIKEGSRLLQAHDMARFREVTKRLWDLVPEETQQETAQRVSDAGIKK